jgi:hypothetical protein
MVTDIEQRIRNAIFAIANHVKVFSYMVAMDTGGNVILVPKLEVDNSEIERPIPEETSEAELLKEHANLPELFGSLVESKPSRRLHDSYKPE